MASIDKEAFQFDVGCTDYDGRFDIRVKAEGKYFLVANANGAITEDTPFRTFYYPGVVDKERAEVFSIAPGTFFDIEFRIPGFEK